MNYFLLPNFRIWVKGVIRENLEIWDTKPSQLMLNTFLAFRCDIIYYQFFEVRSVCIKSFAIIVGE